MNPHDSTNGPNRTRRTEPPEMERKNAPAVEPEASASHVVNVQVVVSGNCTEREAQVALQEALISYDWIEDVRIIHPRGGHVL